jgi:hypothetical protein
VIAITKQNTGGERPPVMPRLPFDGLVLGRNARASKHDQDGADENDRRAHRQHIQSQGQVHLSASLKWNFLNASRDAGSPEAPNVLHCQTVAGAGEIS